MHFSSCRNKELNEIGSLRYNLILNETFAHSFDFHKVRQNFLQQKNSRTHSFVPQKEIPLKL